jgi:hypothetical protein
MDISRNQMTPTQKTLDNRNKHLRKRFGINADEFECIFEAQKGRCGVCGRQFMTPHGGTRLKPRTLVEVDHDHDMPQDTKVDRRNSVRGLLCHRCNSLLPHAESKAV